MERKDLLFWACIFGMFVVAMTIFPFIQYITIFPEKRDVISLWYYIGFFCYFIGLALATFFDYTGAIIKCYGYTWIDAAISISNQPILHTNICYGRHNRAIELDGFNEILQLEEPLEITIKQDNEGEIQRVYHFDSAIIVTHDPFVESIIPLEGHIYYKGYTISHPFVGKGQFALAGVMNDNKTVVLEFLPGIKFEPGKLAVDMLAITQKSRLVTMDELVDLVDGYFKTWKMESEGKMKNKI